MIVDPNGSINTSGNGSTNISGNSTDGNGTVINGDINTSDNGTTNISGNSTNGDGVIVDPNGSINTSDNGTTTIAGNSTNATGVVVDPNSSIHTSGNATTVIIDNGNITVITSNGKDNGGNTENNSGNGGATGSSHGGSGATVAGVLGGIGIVGGVNYLLAAHFAHWYLEEAQPLTLESGDAVFWADATLDQVTMDEATSSADATLMTRAGELLRHMQYRDGADGVKHFAFEDKSSKTKADLSVNMQTHEFFYTESGLKDGKPYVVKAHGWLKHGLGGTKAAKTANAADAGKAAAPAKATAQSGS
ncbi:hypothetical protein BN2476_560001 [Paraburkholderia piptadeniae]|uniref:Uncharacterized protein n=1 Tax=Paraburkholderia piptadeniae TaxID=1701573 RepID=A0A1N7SIJ1_9BURK|nr:hypothetical protein BN2476_560001 [Paraburkholderia piptadeniae]